jgi:hypothetical protein
MVMTINIPQGLFGHTQKPRCFPCTYSDLHEPSGCGVPQRVRADFAFQTRYRDGGFESRFHRLHWPSIELDKVAFRDPLVVPSPKMGEKPRRQRNRRLPFIGGLLSLR